MRAQLPTIGNIDLKVDVLITNVDGIESEEDAAALEWEVLRNDTDNIEADLSILHKAYICWWTAAVRDDLRRICANPNGRRGELDCDRPRKRRDRCTVRAPICDRAGQGHAVGRCWRTTRGITQLSAFTSRSVRPSPDGREKGAGDHAISGPLNSFAYWSRKLRILRLRLGCLSLRRAFASI